MVYGGTVSGAVALAKGGGGTLALDAPNSFSGGAAVGGGQLELDFSAGGGTANLLAAGSPLTLAGGNLFLNAGGWGANSQALGNLTFGPGGSEIRRVPPCRPGNCRRNPDPQPRQRWT